MNSKLKRAWSGVVAFGAAASTILVLNTPAAHAAGTLSGAATVKNAGGAADLNSGDSDTSFTLRLPAGAACPGDSPNDGYRWQTYMVPASVDPATLTFGSAGPLPGGSGANFRQPLYTAGGGDPVVNQQTPAADVSGGPGLIINIPNANYAVFSPGDIPGGAYNIGIACTLGPAGPDQMKNYWNVTKTFTVGGASTAGVTWGVGALPAAPVLTSVTAGDGQLTANFTATASTPATTLYTATATAGAATFTGTSPTGSPISITGLTNGTAYSVTVKATNSLGDSPASNAVSATPVLAARAPVTNLTATAGTSRIDLSWTAPTGPAPTGYQVDVSPVAGSTTVSGTTAAVTGLTPGTNYTFTVTPLHPAPFTAASASTGPVAPLAAQVLVQNVTVTRPAGAIVLTQICGRFGALTADTLATPGFPSGSLPALTAVGGGTAPTTSGGSADPVFAGYPYPENADGTPNATYPTNCGIDLPNAKLVKSGPGAGQFFATSGRLNQVTVVDTRDTDTGWNVTGTMSNFSAGAGKSFSGSQLGWTPVKTSDTAAFADASGVSYDQVVTAGAVVNPNTQNGLGAGKTLGIAAGLAGTSPTLTGGLGIAELDARLKLLIPITAQSGVYVGTLTFSVL